MKVLEHGSLAGSFDAFQAGLGLATYGLPWPDQDTQAGGNNAAVVPAASGTADAARSGGATSVAGDGGATGPRGGFGLLGAAMTAAPTTAASETDMQTDVTKPANFCVDVRGIFDAIAHLV